MAKLPSQLPSGITGAKVKELRNRILFVLGAFLVFRIGTHITVPGIDLAKFASVFGDKQNTLLGMFNMFSGGAFERFSIFALGIMPYISASIVIQLMSYILPSLQAMRKEGESGRRKITKITRYATFFLAIFQAIGISVSFQGSAFHPGTAFIFTAVVTLVTGTMFLMWLGEQITERGIGNGISLLIFAGIVAGLPGGIYQFVTMVGKEIHYFIGLLIIAMVVAITAFVVFVERGQRRIKVDYAKRQQGRRMYAPPSSHLPLKLNMSGVIPPIFASALILFPGTMAQWFASGKPAQGDEIGILQHIAKLLSPDQPIYMTVFTFLIVFFCFFYTALVFNSRETADNLKKSGAFIPGIRPGIQTADYVDSVLLRLTTAGAIYLSFVCLMPDLLRLKWNIPFIFGGTSLLIIVVVVMDFMAQMQAHLLSHQYESLMKKSGFKGADAPGSAK